jgi:hypothetical protein
MGRADRKEELVDQPPLAIGAAEPHPVPLLCYLACQASAVLSLWSDAVAPHGQMRCSGSGEVPLF